MASIAMTVPYLRTSMLHIPRRDLVLAVADSLYLRVTVVDSDNPCAQGIELSGGIGGPGAVFSVWADLHGWHDDYGMLLPRCGQLLHSVAGTHPSGVVGAFDFAFPSGTMVSWPRRCGWTVQLNYDTNGAEVLATGRIVVRPSLGAPFLFDPPALATSAGVPIHTSSGEQVLA
jgi:hypothetical protein